MDTLAVHQYEGAQPGWPPGCQVLGTGSWGWMNFPASFFFFNSLEGVGASVGPFSIFL